MAGKTRPAAAYRLNWNPDKAPGDVSRQDVARCDEDGFVDLNWRCGDAIIEVGTPLFLIRTGRQGSRGLIGVGEALALPRGGYEDRRRRWVSRAVLTRFRVLLREPIVPWEVLQRPPLDTVAWSSQAAAARINEAQCELLQRRAEDALGVEAQSPEENGEDATFLEGGRRRVWVNAYERDGAAREHCLKQLGTGCAVCALDFGERYGEAFRGLIHIHHLVPLSQIRREYQLDPLLDLRPVCPDCHAMLHRRSPPYGIEELRNLILSTGTDQQGAKKSRT